MPRLLIVLALLAAVTGSAVLLGERSDGTSALHILDVGQGDAILLRSGSIDVLIDGGPDATVLRRLSDVRPVWDRTVEVVVLTHPQRDHIAGLLPLLERERVGLVVLPEIPAKTDLFRAVVEAVIRRGISVRFARAGQRITAGDLTLTVLAPDRWALALGQKNPNNGAVVLRVDVARSFSALLTGDIERPAEMGLLRRATPALDADVLKVAHHGSKTSTGARFLRAVSPALAIMSVGHENRHGHPHRGVLRRLAEIRLLRTDSHGTITIRAGGGRLLLSCHPARRSLVGGDTSCAQSSGSRLP